MPAFSGARRASVAPTVSNVRILALASLSATTGCLMQTTAVVRGHPTRIEGGGVAVEALLSKLRLGIEEGYERVHDATDTERHGIAGFDLVARLGFVSLLIETRCEVRPGTYLELRERTCLADPWWFDLGVAGGSGMALAISTSDLVGHAWIGAWADVRLWPTYQHPVLRVEVQRDAYSGSYVGNTQITVGIGWVMERDVPED